MTKEEIAMMTKIALATALISLVLVTSGWAKIGGGDIKFSAKNAADVIYSHDFHVGQRGLKCAECHYQIFARMAHNMRDKATMAEMQAGRSCGNCHNGRRAFGVDKNCERCHHPGDMASGQ
jgi:c(7)-type cytochrome triheme protein